MEIKIALAGNPNSGKTTLFNALTGMNQYVGNWPGVTVEKKEGKIKHHEEVTLIDLPGIYSLSPYTLEEVVARNVLIDERPDAILNIVDGTNLERNLYLTTQLIEVGVPVVIAINMMDVVRRNGDSIQIDELSRRLGCPIVEISALKNTGIEEAAKAAVYAAMQGKAEPRHIFSGTVEHVLAHIEEAAIHDLPDEEQRWYAIKLFERDDQAIKKLAISPDVLAHIEQDIVKMEQKFDDDAESIITNERYLYIDSVLQGCFKKKSLTRISMSDKIDKVVTNRWLALPIFAVIMFIVYAISIGTVGDWTVGFMTDLFDQIGGAAETLLQGWGCATWLIDLIKDGVIGGIGAVLGFVPQMLILFLLLSCLEDCGYMSRVAFIMDRLFRRFGLSGKSFIPMLIATGCGVPGILASRTIEQDRDRKITIMTTGFIPCGAKMPIVGLLAGALFGDSAWIATAAYLLGIGAVVISGIILKKTKPFAGNPAPFVMELPAYHAPQPKNVLRATWERGWDFIKRAGTVIFAASVIIWILNNISVNGTSILNHIGSVLAWLFAPLGFGYWEAAVATVLGLVAKEEVVGVFGALGIGNNAYQAFATIFGGNQLAGFSFLSFNLLCAPCFAAMGAIKREMNNGKWTAFAITYMCVFAYAVSLMIYQFGAWFIGAGNIIGTVVAAVVLVVLCYFLFRKNKYMKKA